MKKKEGDLIMINFPGVELDIYGVLLNSPKKGIWNFYDIEMNKVYQIWSNEIIKNISTLK